MVVVFDNFEILCCDMDHIIILLYHFDFPLILLLFQSEDNSSPLDALRYLDNMRRLDK